MNHLAIDIGTGTLDFVYFDDQKNFENGIKGVIPSPMQSLWNMLNKNLSEKHQIRQIRVFGDVIGGGRVTHLLKNQLAAGIEVVCDPQAALSFRNDPKKLLEFGFKIESLIIENELSVKQQQQLFECGEVFKDDVLWVRLTEIDWSFFNWYFNKLGVNLKSQLDKLYICAQDHGLADPGVPDRRNRFKMFTSQLTDNPDINSLCYNSDNIPPGYLRLNFLSNNAAANFPEVDLRIMDSSPAAIAGCYCHFLNQYFVESKSESNDLIHNYPMLGINLGNNHTICVLVQQGKIIALFEHHTRIYRKFPEKLASQLKKFCQGQLGDLEIFEDQGNGTFYFPGFSAVDISNLKLVVTGPNRRIFRQTGLEGEFAAPGGDMMMTGPVGMFTAAADFINRRDYF